MNKHEKDVWFIKFKKEKSFDDNFNFNVSGIVEKMAMLNELKIRYTENFESSTVASIVERVIGAGSWNKKNKKILDNAKDIHGEKFRIPVVQIVIRRKDFNWKDE